MLGGSISLLGSAGMDLGKYMKNGVITVYGDVDRGIGTNMQNGRINIHGDVFKLDLGYMEGGEIHIYGYAAHIDDNMCYLWRIQATDIYQRGKPLVKDGKLISQPDNKWSLWSWGV